MFTTFLAAIAVILQLQPGTKPEGDGFTRWDGPCQNMEWLQYSSSAPGFDCYAIAEAEEVYLALMVGTVAGEPFPYVILLKLPEQGWRLSAYGYDADWVGEDEIASWIVSRHGYRADLSSEAVAPFLEAVGSGSYDGIPDVAPYPVSEDDAYEIICIDGSTLNITIKTKAGVTTGRRHGCAGRTLLDEFAEELSALATEREPVMARYLDVLSQKED
ncbi:hypothetical protein FF098_014355 [Parvularcula flava]|uniref:Uncharacterized protein n=1 Tax=Aquisalinus luteolus TaxID=1566827 RepID=A0A8J3ERV0_9PROT|nr:hypothetical protein [Aquisalinus luteolus]NHK29101.1 hypothetical protein [Aquisalinus luteolus]GGI00301.1 hypothetical protein GCM10011355_28270 [Aquisalinus luteolus]